MQRLQLNELDDTRWQLQLVKSYYLFGASGSVLLFRYSVLLLFFSFKLKVLAKCTVSGLLIYFWFTILEKRLICSLRMSSSRLGQYFNRFSA